MRIFAFIGYLGWAVLVLLVGGFIVEERRLMEKRISDAFMEGVPPVVERRKDDDWIAEPEHPLSMLLMRPDQTQDALWQCAIVDYFTNGNSFWYIQRSNVSTIASMTAVPPASNTNTAQPR